MFVQITQSNIFNLTQVKVMDVFPKGDENIVRVVLSSRVILDMSYRDRERCQNAVKAILTAYCNEEKTFNLMNEALQPDSIHYEQ